MAEQKKFDESFCINYSLIFKEMQNFLKALLGLKFNTCIFIHCYLQTVQYLSMYFMVLTD